MDWDAVSDAGCKIPRGGVLLGGTFVPFLTNFIDDLGEIDVSFIIKMKFLRTSMTSHKTVLCLSIYLGCCSDTLQAPKICAVVHTSLLHKVQILFQIFLSIF